MANITENVAFINKSFDAKDNIRGKASYKSKADELLNSINQTLKNVGSNFSFDLQEKSKQENFDRQLSDQELKERTKDLDNQANFLIEDELRQISNSINVEDNNLKIKNGIGFSPTEFDNFFMDKIGNLTSKVPEEKKQYVEKSINKLYDKNRLNINNKQATFIRQQNKEKAIDFIKTNDDFIDYSDSTDISNFSNKMAGMFGNTFSTLKGKNRKLINELVVSKGITTLNPNDTLENNKKKYDAINKFVNSKNQGIAPGERNGKLQESLDTSYKKLIKQGKNNFIDNLNGGIERLTTNLDNLNYDSPTPINDINNARTLMDKTIKAINETEYLNSNEKIEKINNIRKKQEDLKNYEIVHKNDIVNVLASNEYINNPTVKRIADKKISTDYNNMLSKNDYKGVAKLSGEVGFITKDFQEYITSGFMSDDVENIKNTTLQVNTLIKYNPSFFNTLSDKNKMEYSVNNILGKAGIDIQPFNEDYRKATGSELSSEAKDFFKNDYLTMEIKYSNNDTEEIGDSIDFNTLRKDKKMFENITRLYGLDTAKKVISEKYKNETPISNNLIIKNFDLDMEDTEKAMEYYFSQKGESVNLNDFFWENDKETNTVIAYPRVKEEYNGNSIVKINRYGNDDKLLIENFRDIVVGFKLLKDEELSEYNRNKGFKNNYNSIIKRNQFKGKVLTDEEIKKINLTK